MFKNFFHKEQKNMAVETPQDWASYFTRIDDKPASIRLNLGLRHVAPIDGYTQRTWFSVKLRDPDENGFTTREEFPAICAIEDNILAALEKEAAIFAGAVKTDGKFDMYLYSEDAVNYESIINSVMGNHPGYLYASDMEEDARWSDYFDFLYPGEYEYQSVMNQRVLINLQEHGDMPELEREVDHWLYFNSEADRDNFITDVEGIGYKVLSKDKRDDSSKAFQLNISRLDNTLWRNVDEYVWELIELGRKNNGDYDGWGCPVAK